MPDDFDDLLDMNEAVFPLDGQRPLKDQADGATMLLYDLVYRRGLTRADFAARGAIDPRAGGEGIAAASRAGR